MAEVSVDDHTEALQLVQVPVDRRHVDVRSPRLHLGGQILCSPVTTGVEEGVQQFTAGRRDPATLAASRPAEPPLPGQTRPWEAALPTGELTTSPLSQDTVPQPPGHCRTTFAIGRQPLEWTGPSAGGAAGGLAAAAAGADAGADAEADAGKGLTLRRSNEAPGRDRQRLRRAAR